MAALESLANLSQPANFCPGSTIGRFRIGEQLGKGGMGEVYRAEDTKLKRVVALKRLASDLRNDYSYRRRFQEEAEKISRFCDPHVAALYDVLELPNEMLLVMEYVEGQTLRQRLLSPLTLDQFFDIAIQCAEALAAAHDLGLIHCDVKPENVMLTGHGQVKILDFGLAKHLPRSGQSSTLDSGDLAGTPAYMSPEILLQERPDGRADVFSLGVMFYEMLTGHHPFLSPSFLMTADRIRNETPARIRVFNSQVPAQLEAVVNRAMAKEAKHRYASARELLEDLRLIHTGCLPLQPLPGSLPPVSRSLERWAVVVIVLLLTGLAGFGLHRRLAKPAPILAERGWVLIGDFDRRGDQAIPDAAIREGLTIALQQSRYVNVFPRARIYDVLQRMKKTDVARIDEEVGREICARENLQVQVVGSVEHVGNVFQISVRGIDPARGRLLFAEQERFDRRDQFFARTDVIARRVREDLGESLAGIESSSRPLAKVTTRSLEALQLYSEAVDAMGLGKLDRVPVLLQEAIRLDPNFAMAHMLLGTYYSWLVGKNGRALAEFQSAHDLRDAVTDREQRRIDAFYYSALERYDEAAQALTLLVSLYPDDAEAHEELAGAYYNVGQLEPAISELRQVLRLSPFSALAYRNLILYLARTGAYDQALDAAQSASRAAIQAPELHWGVGLAYLGQGNVQRAREEFARLGEGAAADQDLRDLYVAMAELYEGKLTEGESQLVRQLSTASPPNEGWQLVRRSLLGRIYLAQSRKPQAAFQADLILRSPDSSLQTNDLLQAGILYARAGQVGKARGLLTRMQEPDESSNSWQRCSYHNLEGEIYLAEAKFAQAENSFATAARASPQVGSHFGLARVYQAQHRWVLASQEWESVLRGKGEILQNDFPPDILLAQVQLARAYEQMERRDLAIEHYRDAVTMSQNGDETQLLRDASREFRNLTNRRITTPTTTP